MTCTHSSNSTGRHRFAAALLTGLCLLTPVGAAALGPSADAKEATYLEYSHNLAAAYPGALRRRLRRMQRRATADLSAAETCRRAVEQIPRDLEDNPHRKIALVAIGPLGREPDSWERRALARISANGERAVHDFVQMVPENGGPVRQVFRYIEPLDALPEPCGDLITGGPGPAISVIRQAGTAEGGARSRVHESTAPVLPLPFPQRRGSGR